MKQSSNNNFYQFIQSIDCSSTTKNSLMKEWVRASLNKDVSLLQKDNFAEELSKENENLKQEIKKLKKRFDNNQILFASLAHEIRTPLHGILGMVNLMEKTPLNTNQVEYTGVTKRSAENLLVIVNDLLLLSKTNVGQVKVRNQPFSAIQFLRDMESLLRVKAEEKNIQLSCRISDDFPRTIVGDKTCLFQILLNLIDNSIKYTNQGYIELTAEVLQNNGTDIKLRFAIKDTGIGIKEEKLSLLFNSFSRVHDEKQSGDIEGLGLGLSIVKKLTKLLNGSIIVDSKFGIGSNFTIELPFSLPKEEVLLEKKTNLSIPKEWKTKKILMIEDNKANVLYAKEIFDDWGLNLCVVNNLSEATDKLKSAYHCILCDVKLPDGNGLNFISDLRKNNNSINKNTPCIILTASRNEDGVVQFDKEYIQGYLNKPFPPNQLLAELKKIILVEHPEQSYTPENQQQNISIVDKNIGAPSATEFKSALSKRFKARTNLMIEMLKIFLDQSPVMLDVLENSPSQKDYEKLRFEAHKFKSTVNIIGLIELRNYAAKVESAFEKGESEEDTTILLRDFITQLKMDHRMIQVVLDEMMMSQPVN